MAGVPSAATEALIESRPLEENCGVFGVYGRDNNASRVVFFALYALNHRGQESAGIASYGKSGITVHKGMGLVSQVFDEHSIEALKGSLAIGHTRYSTAGGSKLTGAQPFVLETDLGQLAIAHNGQIARQNALRKIVLKRGIGLFTTSDSEMIAQLLARPHDPADAAAWAAQTPADVLAAPGEGAAAVVDVTSGSGGASARPSSASSLSGDGIPVWACWVSRIGAFMRDCEGAYSLVALTKEAIYGCRDPYGLRPLCIGQLTHPDGTSSYYLASESCALATVGASHVREVAPGEVVRLDKSGIKSWLPLQKPALATVAPLPAPSPAFCVFEYVYFARPDSVLEEQQVHTVRTRLGARLSREAPVPSADIVSGVPDSSIAAAIGYAAVSGKPFSEVFCKNRYIGRTFIKPDDQLRKNAIQLKYNPLTHVLAGRSVVLVDDSLVRGNTLRQLVPLLRRGGAREVHVRISSPPIRHPCYYGVDIGSYEELITSHLSTLEQVREYIGADSLAYLSHEGMMEAVNDRSGGDAVLGSAPAPAPAAAGAASIAIGASSGAGAGGASSGAADSCEGKRTHCSACFTGVYPIPHDNTPEA